MKKAVVLIALLNVMVVSLAAKGVKLISKSNTENQANDHSETPSMSSDGRFIAFKSWADNLIAVDGNAKGDIFVYDCQEDIIERVSVPCLGCEANDSSMHPSISADGRYVAFTSYATNLVGGDTNGTFDIFVYDRETHTVSMVSVDDLGNQGNSSSLAPSISANGQYIAFESSATNLVGTDTNLVDDIFVYDQLASTIERVSVDDIGNEGNLLSREPCISANGRYVAFASLASNLVSGDTNAAWDVFVHDRQTKTIERVSVDNSGNQGIGDSGDVGGVIGNQISISADGRYVAFPSDANNLVDGDSFGRDILVYDRNTKTIELISINAAGNNGTSNNQTPSISADGRYVVFSSSADNLINEDDNGKRDVFVRDRQRNNTFRININEQDDEGDDHSYECTINADGSCVAFRSAATNLVANDNGNYRDIFLAYPCGAEGAPKLTVKTVVDPSRSDYITILVNANERIDCSTSYLVVEPYSASHDPVTLTSLSKVDSTTCEGSYHRNQGFGDVKTITAYVYDFCGNLGISDGTFEREITNKKRVILAHNLINPTISGDEAVLQYRLSQTGRVQIEIFDKRGRLVCTLVDNEVEAGTHQLTWAGKNDKGETVASGIYFITIRTSEYTVKERIVVIK